MQAANVLRNSILEAGPGRYLGRIFATKEVLGRRNWAMCKTSYVGLDVFRLFLVKPLITVVISTHHGKNILGFLMPRYITQHHDCTDQCQVGSDPSPGPSNCSELEPMLGSVIYSFFLNQEYLDLSEEIELQRWVKSFNLHISLI